MRNGFLAERYMVRNGSGKFYIGFEYPGGHFRVDDNKKLLWVSPFCNPTVIIQPGCRSRNPYAHEVQKALKEILTLSRYFDEVDEEWGWWPGFGWMYKNRAVNPAHPDAILPPPWRKVIRRGMSGCLTGTIIGKVPEDIFGNEYKIASLHISMYEKISYTEIGVNDLKYLLNILIGEIKTPKEYIVDMEQLEVIDLNTLPVLEYESSCYDS